MLGCTEAKQKDEHFEAVNGISKVDKIHLTLLRSRVICGGGHRVGKG